MNTTTVNTERIAAFEKVIAELVGEGDVFHEYESARDQLHGGERFTPECIMLVERSVQNGHLYVTLHGQLGDAGDYNTGQEYAEDWPIEFAVNLDTGKRYTAEYTVAWEDA